MKKIIVLIGKADSGKTATLRRLICELAGVNGENLQDLQEGHRYPTFISQRNIEKLRTHEGDICVKVVYKGLEIGISSAGDSVWQIESKFELLKACDVFICASRAGRKISEYIEKLAVHHSLTAIYKVRCIKEGDAQAEQRRLEEAAIEDIKGILEIFMEKEKEKTNEEGEKTICNFFGTIDFCCKYDT